MSKIPIFIGKVNDKGELNINPANFKSYREWLKTLACKTVQITVKRLGKQRSTEQNRYYFGVVISMLSDESGHSRDEMHSAMKLKFLSYYDQGLLFTRSTTELTTKEMEAYIEDIKRFAMEFYNLYIPNPQEVEF